MVCVKVFGVKSGSDSPIAEGASNHSTGESNALCGPRQRQLGLSRRDTDGPVGQRLTTPRPALNICRDYIQSLVEYRTS